MVCNILDKTKGKYEKMDKTSNNCMYIFLLYNLLKKTESNNINRENIDFEENIIFELLNENYNYNYGNGNGTLIDQVILDNKRITTRKFEDILELYSVNEGYRANGNNTLELLKEPNMDSGVVYQLPFYPIITKVSTTFFRYEESANKNEKKGWLYVTTDNGENGWLYLGLYIRNPFENGKWSILETITIQNKTWTVRKLDGWLVAEHGRAVRDNPG